jgi:alkanesulfonate monooxygenase SsuD/methylene tetrahydromethanopterin reductase-like flavin-dependent oxidoreductase (luciferase family)
VHREEDFGSWQKVGMAIAGSPETIAEILAEQIGALGINYLIAYLFFGTMSAAEAGRSLELYTSEVMPRLANL